MRILLFALLLLAGVLWYWGLYRSSVVFTLAIRDGRIVRSRGRIPPRMMLDLTDIADRAGIVRADIVCVVRDGEPKLLFKGELDPGLQQQFRNVAGQFTAEQLRSSKKR